MELLKDEQITLNIDGFVISQNLHNKATATSLFGITDKDNLNIGHDDRTWVLEKDIICDTCNKCVGCQTCVSCNGCVGTVGCNDSCQGCTGSCTGCADGCYETCFGDCYTCQDCQTGCTSCNACTAGCDGGCQTECYACVSCDGCVGCNGDCVGCFGGCQESCQTCTGCANCTSCVSCQTGCQTGCYSCFGCNGNNYDCQTSCQTTCQTCTGCDNNCYKGCTSCDGCTSGCQTGCQTGCQICTAGCQTCVSCNGCTTCNGCDSCVGCTSCVGSCVSCNGCTICTDGCYSGCDGGCQAGCHGSMVCDSCTGSCQTGCTTGCNTGCTTGCNTGCTTGNYCYSNQCGSNTGPEEDEQEEVDLYCADVNGGGAKKGTNTGCKSAPYDGAKSTAPKAWLKSGKTQEQWDAANKEEKLEFCEANNIKVNIKDPKGQDGKEFIGAELSELQKMNPAVDHVDYEYDEETGQNIGVAYDKDGNKLLDLKETAAGEFEVSSTDGKKAGTTKVNTETGKTEKPLNVEKTNDDGSKESYDDEKGNTYTGTDGKEVPIDSDNKGAGC